MPVKIGPLLFLYIVCYIVWLSKKKSFVTGYEFSREAYAEVKEDSFENFEQELVLPVELMENGQLLQAEISRTKREVHTLKKRYFDFEGHGERFHLELHSARSFLAPSFRVYHRGGNVTYGVQEDKLDLERCLYRGQVKDQLDSAVALNLCGGMTGLIKTENSDYLIEPAIKDGSAIHLRPHRLTKRSVPQSKNNPKSGEIPQKKQKFFCGKKRRYMPHKPRRKDYWLPDEFSAEKIRNNSSKKRTKRWADKQTMSVINGRDGDRKRHPQQRRKRRSVETLVVADREMVRKHGTENVTTYLLTVFNMVSMLYQDSTIGSNVSVILVGLVLLEGDEPGLTLSHNAENSLNSFCQWQSTIHTSKGHQHDHAVLVTGLDICSWKNEPCDTLGYAPISGMCSKYRSCTVNEDSGLALAFTVAHEIGHNFGMIHDGQGSSPCRRKRGTLMSASLSGLDTSVLWSDCSKRDLAKFLESPRSSCLKNEPDSPDELQFPNHLPGQLYDADMQCRLQFGTKSKLCEHYPRQNEVCRALWCQRNGRECETKFLPAAEGTPCGISKWCRKGVCADRVLENYIITDGAWSPFSAWSPCSTTCRGGLMYRERFCDSPPPSIGGSYCKGEEKEYSICNTQECSVDQNNHGNDQCATFNKRTVKGKLYKWRPYGKDLGALSRCRIYCVPDKDDLYLVLSTKLQDGTSCSGNYSNVCVAGECRAVGCDGKIESSIVPDRCGVCNGNNSTCKTIRGTFIASNLSSGYHEVVKIPSHSRHINISEAEESPTYLALKRKTAEYLLNGNWTLDWPGRYNLAGTLFSYRRWPGKPENLLSKGPINDDLIVEVLAKELAEIVVNYEFVVSLTKHHWKLRNSSCSVSCGNGTLLTQPVCVNSLEETTSSIYCNNNQKPKIGHFPCILAKCTAKWYVGDWSTCSDNSCDPGLQTRPVYCSENNVKVANSKCDELVRPIDVRECSKVECHYAWFTGSWSRCRGKCSIGFQTRSITCRQSENETAESFSNCKKELQPPHMRKCLSEDCFNTQSQEESSWSTGPWSKCNGECGEGKQERNVTCIKKINNKLLPSTSCIPDLKPDTRQNCFVPDCDSSASTGCKDEYHWCTTSTNQRLCKLKFYSNNCCISCKR